MKKSKKILCAFLAVSLISGCASSKSTGTSGALSSEEAQEVAIGHQIHQTILSQFTVYSDPKVTVYVDRIGQSLAAHARRRELSYHFSVLYSDKIYATSSPGGFVYVTTGMLYFIENEAELSAVLAHEIAQLQYKDPQNRRAHKVLENVTKGSAMVGPAFGPIGVLAVLGLVTATTVTRPRTLTDEARLINADKNALQYMLAAGEDPQGMVDFLYKFLKADAPVLPYFYDYHQSRPITQPRFDALNKNFSKLNLQDKSFNTNRDVYQEVTRGVREIYKQ